MTTRTLAVVSGGLSSPSSTRLLADRLTTATVAALRARGEDATVYAPADDVTGQVQEVESR